MSTAQLFNIPRSEADREVWLFANDASHQYIIERLQAKNPGKLFTRFSLNPVLPNDEKGFLLRHQQMHVQMDEFLGIAGNDYSTLDPNKPEAVDTIWQQHADEHIQAELKART